jgi:hypothetical protein
LKQKNRSYRKRLKEKQEKIKELERKWKLVIMNY